jgi:hypothetical protein
MAEYEKEGALSRHAKPAHGGHHGGSKGEHPHLHFHKHDGGVTAHVMHHDGTHEVHHFDHGDHDGMADLIKEHMGPGAPPEGGEPPEHMAEGASPEQEQQEQEA